MNNNEKNNEKNTRKLIYRGGLVLFFLLVAVFLFNIGKGHKLIFINKEVVLDGKTYQPGPSVKIMVGNLKKPLQVNAGFQNETQVAGNNHRMTVDRKSVV